MSLTAADASESEFLLESGEESVTRLSAGRRLWPAVPLAAVLGLVVAAATWGRHPRVASLDDLIFKPEVCSDNGANCQDTKCCKQPGMTCYVKNEGWASCNETCDKHMKWNHDTNKFERREEVVWNCSSLSGQSEEPEDAAPAADPVPVLACSPNGQDCSDSKCCADAGSRCYKKNDGWASCNATCDEYMLWIPEKHRFEKQDEKVWDCTELVPAPPTCTANGHDCSESKCCADAGSKCYKKNDGWASCNATCDKYMLWNTHTNRFEKQDEEVWDCAVLSTDDEDAAPTACDTSACDRCSGEQCTYCREERERECCLNEACWGSSGEASQNCRANEVEACCEGQSGHCMSSFVGNTTGSDDGSGGSSSCDLSGCHGCQGEQCTYCNEERERDCCLNEMCFGIPSGDPLTKCREDNVQACCTGKTGRCETSFVA